MLRSMFKFDHATYAEETAIRNGDKIEVRHITPGQRSQLGDEVQQHHPRSSNRSQGLQRQMIGVTAEIHDPGRMSSYV